MPILSRPLPPPAAPRSNNTHSAVEDEHDDDDDGDRLPLPVVPFFVCQCVTQCSAVSNNEQASPAIVGPLKASWPAGPVH